MRSREDYKRGKDLDEARKAGIAPAAIDTDGRDINPHIPQYMTKGLWYLNQEGVTTTLMHQKNWKTNLEEQNIWYDRGAKIAKAKIYRHGACENCGSMNHTPKFCLERPRKIGAKFTGKHIAADDKIQNLMITKFEAKRDRWNGFDANEYSKLFDRHEKIEELRRDVQKQKPREVKPISITGYEDEDKVKDEELMNFDKVEKRVNTVAGGSTGTVRNLRIREDTAKYLLNLDLESAYYDPKSRSMRKDPDPSIALYNYYKGDNNLKTSGREYQEFVELQLHQLDATNEYFKCSESLIPTKAETLFGLNKIAKKRILLNKKMNLISKYCDSLDID